MGVANVIIHTVAAKEMNSTLIATILASIGLQFMYSFGFSITIQNSTIYISMITTLKKWCKNLKERPDSFHSEGLYFVDAICMAEEAVSDSLFYTTLVYTVTAIAVSFRSLTFFADSAKLSTEDTILGLLCMLFGVGQCFIMFLTSTSSQSLVDEINELQKSIRGNQRCKGWVNCDDPKINHITEELRAFQGFSGKGYFTLNKSFLTSFVANFLTYFIILIQFSAP